MRGEFLLFFSLWACALFGFGLVWFGFAVGGCGGGWKCDWEVRLARGKGKEKGERGEGGVGSGEWGGEGGKRKEERRGDETRFKKFTMQKPKLRLTSASRHTQLQPLLARPARADEEYV